MYHLFQKERKKKMNKYMVCIDNGFDCYFSVMSANNENEAVEFVAGIGDVVKVKEIIDECHN